MRARQTNIVDVLFHRLVLLDQDHFQLFLLRDIRGRRLKSEVGGLAAGARQVFDPGGGDLNLPLPTPLFPPTLSFFAPSTDPPTRT